MRQDVEQRPDPLWREHMGRSRRRTAVIVVGVLAAYAAVVIAHPQGACSLPGAGPCRVAEMRRWGRGRSTAVHACRQGRRKAWFEAVVRNTSGDRTAVLCDVDAFRASGERIGTTIPLPVYIVQEPGVMWLNAHETRIIEWFFDPHDSPRGITAAVRFIASCRRNPRPPV
jgi:hypothetical protein